LFIARSFDLRVCFVVRSSASPVESSLPDKTKWSKKMSKDIFLFFYALAQVYLQYKGMENKSGLRKQSSCGVGF